MNQAPTKNWPGLKWGQDFKPGQFLVGAWFIKSTLARFDGGTENDTAGFYFVIDQILYAENPEADAPQQGIGAYFQYGYADENVSRLKHHFGGGMQWIGAIPTRDRDVWGTGISYVEFSDKNEAGFDDNYEAAFEVFYQAKITPYLFVDLNLQYIANPGGLSERGNALVPTVHVGIIF